MKYQVLLYYKYVAIEDPDKEREMQRKICKDLNLLGRIIVAKEGINGTVEGAIEHTEKYIEYMQKSTYFKDISYKKSIGTGEAFKKLSIKTRDEVVTTGITGLDPTKTTGKYITAQVLHQWFEEKKEFYLVDMRNEYEYASGYFENFIPSGMKHFRDLSSVLPRLKHLKNKRVVTVCTGGIRCEKASGFLVQNGFGQVYQLQDGIQSYMEQYPDEYFKGNLYVFDKRMTVGFGSENAKHAIVGKCHFCSVTHERYVNCSYDECHDHYICCDNCLDKETGLAFCNTNCKENYLKGMAKRSMKASFTV